MNQTVKKKKKISQAEYIIEKFGGYMPMARALGLPHASRVQTWSRKGFIPAWHHVDILKAAMRHDINLVPEDFLTHLKNDDHIRKVFFKNNCDH